MCCVKSSLINDVGKYIDDLVAYIWIKSKIAELMTLLFMLSNN